MEKLNNYQKYRWFYTSTGKLVVGGKNAEQNEELVKEMLKSGKDYLVFHTSTPGSPFSFILAEKKELSVEDIYEAAVFTACFSHEWKKKKNKTDVDIFTTKQISKRKGMKTGAFSVKGEIKTKEVKLELYLEKQDGKVRAVPYKLKSRLKLTPGELSKEKTAEKLAELGYAKEQLIQALPSGGFRIIQK